jgi:hypothetical protein
MSELLSIVTSVRESSPAVMTPKLLEVCTSPLICPLIDRTPFGISVMAFITFMADAVSIAFSGTPVSFNVIAKPLSSGYPALKMFSAS